MTDIYRDRPPLWQVMNDSYGIEGTAQDSYAAIIRAIADWLAPPDKDAATEPFAIRFTTLRSVLLAEADKAEASEQ